MLTFFGLTSFWYVLTFIILYLLFLLTVSTNVRFNFFVNSISENRNIINKQVAITFDDGPVENTLEILKVLEKYDVKAGFFCIGKHTEAQPEIFRKIIEDGYFRPHDTAVIEIPQKAPEGAILRKESVFNLLNRVKKVSNEWIRPGNTKGMNSHNVSATISVKEDEWDLVGEWMWNNRDSYNGIAVLPYDGGGYEQAPFEDCNEETYNKMCKTLSNLFLFSVNFIGICK